MKWWKLGFVMIGTGACIMPLGCAMDDGASADSQRYGAVRMPLIVEANGFVYELQNAVFTITGVDEQSYPMPPGQSVFELSLASGDYSLFLEPGWELSRTDPGTGLVEPLTEAVLQSDNPVEFQIATDVTTQLLFSFSVDGTIIEFGDGVLQVGLEVCDSTGCVSNLDPSGTGGVSGSGGTTSTGGTAGTGIPSNFAMDGYGQNGMWMGHLFTAADPSSIISPDCNGGACFTGSGPELCVNGSVTPSPAYDTFALLGWNLNQPEGSATPGVAIAEGAGVFVHLEGPQLDNVLVQLQGPSGQLYCAPYHGVPEMIYWEQFNTQCWDGGSGEPFSPGAPLLQMQFIVPTNGVSPVPFDFCLIEAAPF